MSPNPGNPSSFQDIPDEWCCCCCPLDPIPQTVLVEFCGSTMDGISITLELVEPDRQSWKGTFPPGDESWSGKLLEFACYECGYLINCHGIIYDGAMPRCCDPLDVLIETMNYFDGYPVTIHVTA